jgi:hypothetical protein
MASSIRNLQRCKIAAIFLIGGANRAQPPINSIKHRSRQKVALSQTSIRLSWPCPPPLHHLLVPSLSMRGAVGVVGGHRHNKNREENSTAPERLAQQDYNVRLGKLVMVDRSALQEQI